MAVIKIKTSALTSGITATKFSPSNTTLATGALDKGELAFSYANGILVIGTATLGNGVNTSNTIIANKVIGGSAFFHQDSSGLTGSGDNVLANTPTLVTPTIAQINNSAGSITLQPGAGAAVLIGGNLSVGTTGSYLTTSEVTTLYGDLGVPEGISTLNRLVVSNGNVGTGGGLIGLKLQSNTMLGVAVETSVFRSEGNSLQLVAASTATVAFAKQRYNVFKVPTDAVYGSGTITNAATVAIEGPPVVSGVNAVITNPYAFWVETGNSLFNGTLTIAAGGLTVNGGNLTLGTATIATTGTIASGAITSTGAIAGTSLAATSGSISAAGVITGTSLALGTGTIASGAITSSGAISTTTTLAVTGIATFTAVPVCSTQPTSDNQLANKLYVDTVALGLHVHPPADVISTAGNLSFNLTTNTSSAVTSATALTIALLDASNISFAGTSLVLLIDGISGTGAGTGNGTPTGNLVLGSRIVITGDTVDVQQCTAGIYYIRVFTSTSLILERALDANFASDLNGGDFIFVKYGSAYADTGFVQTQSPGRTTSGVSSGTVNGDAFLQPSTGTTSTGPYRASFVQFSQAGIILAGDGLAKTGNTLRVVGTTNSITVASGGAVSVSTTYAGGTSITTVGTVATGTIDGGTF